MKTYPLRGWDEDFFPITPWNFLILSFLVAFAFGMLGLLSALPPNDGPYPWKGLAVSPLILAIGLIGFWIKKRKISWEQNFTISLQDQCLFQNYPNRCRSSLPLNEIGKIRIFPSEDILVISKDKSKRIYLPAQLHDRAGLLEQIRSYHPIPNAEIQKRWYWGLGILFTVSGFTSILATAPQIVMPTFLLASSLIAVWLIYKIMIDPSPIFTILPTLSYLALYFLPNIEKLSLL